MLCVGYLIGIVGFWLFANYIINENRRKPDIIDWTLILLWPITSVLLIVGMLENLLKEE